MNKPESAIVTSLRNLAHDFDVESVENVSSLVAADSLELAAATLRLVAILTKEGTYDEPYAYVWLHAGRSVLTATKQQRVHA